MHSQTRNNASATSLARAVRDNIAGLATALKPNELAPMCSCWFVHPRAHLCNHFRRVKFKNLAAEVFMPVAAPRENESPKCTFRPCGRPDRSHHYHFHLPRRMSSPKFPVSYARRRSQLHRRHNYRCNRRLDARHSAIRRRHVGRRTIDAVAVSNPCVRGRAGHIGAK